MSEKRLRISIFGLLVAVAIASFGCGGGSRANSTRTGNDFITAVMPDTDSTSKSESENAPAGSKLKTQNAQQVVDNGNQEESRGNAPAGSAQNTEPEQQVVDKGNREVDFQEEDYPLSWEHGLGEGKYVVRPGKSKRFGGNVVITCPSSGKTCLVYVGTDGSVTYSSGLGIPSFTLIPPVGFPDIPWPQPNEAAQAPVVELDFGSTLHVGSNAAPRADELTRGVDRNGARVSYGDVQDGIGSEKLLEFMNQHVSFEEKSVRSNIATAPGLETFVEPPTIRLAEGTSDLYARYAAHAVQLINSALPYEKRITISSEPIPSQDQLSEGEIFLEFGSLLDSSVGGTASRERTYNEQQTEVQSTSKASITINEEAMRLAEVYNPVINSYQAGENWETKTLDSRVENTDTIIKWYNDKIFLSVLVHELSHSLGFYHIDVSRFSASIMNNAKLTGGKANEYTPYLDWPTFVIFVSLTDTSSHEETTTNNERATINYGEITTNNEETTNQSARKQGYLVTPDARTVPGHILFPMDRAALLAAYGRFQPGAQPEDLTTENLGTWSDTSFHLLGEMDFPDGQVSFGVASSNGLAQPWARGTAPWTNLADNEALSGSATWSGALLGVGSSSETVAGDARLTVGLTNLTGRIDFTNMEKWGVGEAPGASGSGATWGDGDLGYTVRVNGNTFVQTGGDAGYVTGAFFGAAHEAMGGVLERADLAAGFGGKR